MTNSKKYQTQQKSLKARDNLNILKEYSPLLHSEKIQHNTLKYNNKRCKICNIIIEGKSYTFKNPESKFKINILAATQKM